MISNRKTNHSCVSLENHPSISSDDGFVVVGWIDILTIAVENGDGPFPSLPSQTSPSETPSHQEETQGFWNFLFGSPVIKKFHKKFALFVRDVESGECFGLENRRVELEYSNKYEIIQNVMGREYILFPRDWTNISNWRERLGGDLNSLSLRNDRFPVFESIVRYGNVLLSDYGAKFGVPEIESNVIYNYWECSNEQRKKMVERLYEIDLDKIDIHPLYYILAFTEFGKSLRYHKLVKKYGKAPSPNLESILYRNSLNLLSKCPIEIITHFNYWLHIPVLPFFVEHSPFSATFVLPIVKLFNTVQMSRFDWLKERMFCNSPKSCIMDNQIDIESSFGKAREEIIHRSTNNNVNEMVCFKLEHLACSFEIENGNTSEIYWRGDTFIVYSENLEETCQDLIHVVSELVKNMETVDFEVSFEFVDMRYMYRIELELEKSKIITSTLSQFLETNPYSNPENDLFVVKTISNQVRNIEVMVLAIITLCHKYDDNLSMKIPNRIQAIILLSEWIDSCLEFSHIIQRHFLKHFNFPQIDKYFDEFVLEKLIRNQLNLNDIYEMAKYLSILNTDKIQNNRAFQFSGLILNAFSAWVEK